MNAPATTVAQLRQPAQIRTDVTMGFSNLESFELMQRAAKLLASSTLVPAAYRAEIHKTDRYGNITDTRQNPNALANAVVALNMAQRMGADPLMVMQNLYIVEGRPSWSSQWIIAAINGCGRFSPLRFDIKVLGKKKVEHVSYEWSEDERGRKQRREVRKTVEIEDKVCVAWAIEKETGERIESPAVSIEMAVKEGWYTKNGSKWQTMDEVMLRYRTASFFGKLYAPELLMGLQTVEEIHDTIDATITDDGTLQVDADALREAPPQRAPRQPRRPAPASEQATDVEIRDDAPEPAADASPGNSDPAPQAQPAAEAEQPTYLDAEKVRGTLLAATDRDFLDVAADSIQDCDPATQESLRTLYHQRAAELDNPFGDGQPVAPRARRAVPDME